MYRYDLDPLGVELCLIIVMIKKVEVQDPLEEVNIGLGNENRLTYISALLSNDFRNELVKLLKENQD